MLHLQLSERDVERLFAGDQPQGRQDLAEVARFVARLRALSDIEYPPPMNPRLLAELDVAEAERPPGAPDEMQRRRDEEQHRAHVAKRRWRVVGAAAMVASLGGVMAAAQAQGSDPTPRDSDPVEAEPVGPSTTPPQLDASQGTKPPPTTAAPPPSTVATPPPAEQPSASSADEPAASNPPADSPPVRDWTQCGADPQCWMDLWPNFVPGAGGS